MLTFKIILGHLCSTAVLCELSVYTCSPYFFFLPLLLSILYIGHCIFSISMSEFLLMDPYFISVEKEIGSDIQQ